MIRLGSSTKRTPYYSLRKRLTAALVQDQGPLGDVTTLALVPKAQTAKAEFVVKADQGVLSGLNVAREVFDILNPKIKFTPLLSDGEQIKKSTILATLEGPAQSILSGERVALEFIRRMSGIATKTSHFVKAVKDTNTVILDTRKVAPSYGDLDKQAVRDGGGKNHRLNLSEMGLIKNNHIDLLSGNIAQAIKLFRKRYPHIPLEVEVRNHGELVTALENKPDRVLLDNMTTKKITEAVKIRNNFEKRSGQKIPLEASGNMTLDRVLEVANTGVEFISVGALTHSVQALDISLHISFNK
jgi:nicotinate-nucleotide pyrophosphorylase (carboxylating)